MNKFHADKGTYNELVPEVIIVEVSYQFMRNFNYLVIDPSTNYAVVVDPAWQIEKIDHELAINHAILKGILITHSHADHIDLAKPLAQKYNCPIWMSKEEIAVSGFNAEQLIGIDENPWRVGKMLIQPISTPGHTVGCFCYLVGDNLFTGDVLFAEGCGICPNTEAAHAMFYSLENLKATLNPQTRIFPGHSYGIPPGQLFSQLLRDNIYLQFSDKESFAAFRLRSRQNRAKMFSFN